MCEYQISVIHILYLNVHTEIIYNEFGCLKLPSLFAVWLFLTFHNKSHNMKELFILSDS